MAAVFNLAGAMWGTAVATTIGRGLVDMHALTMVTVLAAPGRRHHLGPLYLVAGAAIEFKSRACGRTLRRGGGHERGGTGTCCTGR
jgi:hypothetical protein